MSLKTDESKLEAVRLKEVEGMEVAEIADHLDINKFTLYKFFQKKTHKAWWDTQEEKPVAAGYYEDPNLADGAPLGEGIYVFTSAQNNTFVHKNFLATIEKYCEYNDAQLFVSGFTYNKNGFQNSTKDDEDIWYDPSIKKYMLNERILIAEDLMFCGEMNILPTATKPLTNIAPHLRGCSGIVPHAKLQLESLPTFKGENSKLAYTTGSVTLRNYIKKRSGQLAEKNHVFSALVVEVDGEGDWFVRQLVAGDDGTFYDLDLYYTADEVYCSEVEAITWGDVHVEKYDEDVTALQWGSSKIGDDWVSYHDDSIIDVLRPSYQFMNDTLDMAFRNHHNINNSDFRFEQFIKGEESVESSVRDAAAFLGSIERDFCQTVVVESNHDLALNKWLAETGDFKTDPVNARYYLELNLHRYLCMEAKKFNDQIFKYALMEQGCPDNIIFLREDEQFDVLGVDCGHHGHLGADGARGGMNSFRRVGKKINSGHTHKAAIYDGVWYAGISCSKEMGYNRGPSSWNWSFIIIYPNGKRSIVTIRNGKWRK